MEAILTVERKATIRTAPNPSRNTAHHLDRMIVIFLIFVLLPIHTIIAVLIKLTSKGPVFYTEEREGRHGKRFRILKYRTMHTGTPATWFTNPREQRMYEKDRITFIGKLLRCGIDELPQLINIWRGEMTFVGPRPPILGESLANPHYLPRTKGVLPGITGWEQTSSARDKKDHDRQEYDEWYYERKCFLLNAYIVCVRTPFHILFRKKWW